MRKRTYYIRKAATRICSCWNVSNNVYSIKGSRKVLGRVCEKCFRYIRDTLKGYDLVLLSFNPNPILPKFLKRIDDA